MLSEFCLRLLWPSVFTNGACHHVAIAGATVPGVLYCDLDPGAHLTTGHPWMKSRGAPSSSDRVIAHRSITPGFVVPAAPSCIDNIIHTRWSGGRCQLRCDAPV